jgi:teichuronic acid biosynthesis glycosyltransferase TuaC
MRLLTFTNLYPSDAHPRHGIFVEERLRQIVARGDVDARVVVPTPLPPGVAAPAPVVRHGIPVEYVAVPRIRGVTNWVDPLIFARAAAATVRRLLGERTDDVAIDAHFLYPDAVAGVLLGRRFGVPVVMSARGSDVNVKCRHPIMRAWVRWAAARSDAVITVSQALADALAKHGIRAPRCEVLPNGVDLDKFRPLDRDACRSRLRVDGRVLLSVGHLVEPKGHAIAIEALAGIAGATLLIVGEGPERAALESLAARLGVSSRVRFLGLVPHAEMAGVYSAADVLVLASAREGMPNVVLESIACGTPVAATAVGGIVEVVTDSAAGEIFTDRSAAGLGAALARVFGAAISRADTRRFAERFGWARVIDRQRELYRSVVERAPGTARTRSVST